jgi:NADPH-dependent glutamate synthase beta subunit-like oxidoreductase
MKWFEHHNAHSIREAVQLLKAYEGKARVNAGGTDLLGALRDRVLSEYPDAVINIKAIDGLDYIKKDKKGLRIGALARLTDIAKSSVVKEEYKLLAEAVHSAATPHVRNMATIGGNLAQDVRCWFYRYPRQIGGPIVCLRKGGKFCSALTGDNRYHSIFGTAGLTERPCASRCPARTDIPTYLSKVRTGDLAEAARILMEYNPMPAVTGRVCPVFCEPECNRGAFDEPVAIQCVEREVGDYVLGNINEFFAPPLTESGKRIAVVGSGPAALAAAFYLRRAGHRITVYERLPEPGGMLRYSIPPYRLPKQVVRKHIQALEGMGIAFETGVNVGKDVTIEKLSGLFDAVFLAGGTWQSLKLGAPGGDAEGVLYALDYLREVNSGRLPSLGKRVIVVGGGSVAIDAARTARRLGATEVQLVCLECRDFASKDRMLALDSEVLEAEEEGIIVHDCLGVKEIVTKAGKVTALNTMRCLSVREADGTFNPQFDSTCVSPTLEADSIIVAIGQAADRSLAPKELSYTQTGTLAVDPDRKTIFAGGDMVSGPSTVVQAIASAREAALRIDELLNGGLKAAKEKPDGGFSISDAVSIPRVAVHHVPPTERIKSIDIEDVHGLSMSEIEREAQRCFNCGCLAVNPSDIAVALIALNARIVTTKRSLPAELFFKATATSSTVLEPDEMIKEIQIPKPPTGTRQSYEKFTLRKPIDFAIVSVAYVLTMDDDVCKDARIVLGAVAPEPVRARGAEQMIKGQTISEDMAGEAAKLALAGANPLDMNSYKVEIAKALVKRAIVG